MSGGGVLVVDNYDSFTFNLVQYLEEMGAAVDVVRNDAATVAEIAATRPAAIVMSPGPKTPDDAGVCVDVVRELGGAVPILGVCLGLQAIAVAYGGAVVRAPEVVHGKVRPVHHDGAGVLEGLENPFMATRYHSLVVDGERLPQVLEVTAWSEDSLIMAARHRELRVEGVQFHPESIGTPCGRDILRNFLRTADVPVAA